MLKKINVDRIVKNAKVFTSDKNNLHATSFAVKDGKFVYVGNEEGIKDYEGEVVDMGGKFVMPSIIDSHIHIVTSVMMDSGMKPVWIMCEGKKDCLDFIAKYISENPELGAYRFMLNKSNLLGEKLIKEELDVICKDKAIVIQESECHSAWVNSKIMNDAGITDETPDIAKGLSYYEKDEKGHKTGYMVEMTVARALGGIFSNNISNEKIRESLKSWIDFSVKHGETAVFEAGTPGGVKFHEKVYDALKDMDEKGELPILVDGSYAICDPAELDGAMEILRHFKKKFNSKHMRFNTLKIVLDGTMRVHTAYMLSPYVGTDCIGGRLFNERQIADIIKMINAEGFDLHIHTVAEGAARTALDGVELAQKELGKDFHTQVTLAHLELVHNDDIIRFKKLGVFANYTPWWHYGDCGDGNLEEAVKMLGKERANNLYRCKSVYDTGANVCFSSDSVMFDFQYWNPYLGMEVAMCRQMTEKTKVADMFKRPTAFPQENEKMSIEECILCYTINNAKQLGIADKKGSIEVGKDADFAIFNQNLLTKDKEGFSHVMPEEVYLEGKKF